MPTARAVVAAFATDVERVYGDRLEQLAVHDGWTQGGTTSDIDLAVVLRGRVGPGTEVDRLIDLIWTPLRDHGALLVVTPVPARKAKRSNGRFWRELRETRQPWDEADLDRDLPALPDPTDVPSTDRPDDRASLYAEVASAKWDLAESNLYADWMSGSITSGGQMILRMVVQAWNQLRYLGRPPEYDEAVRNAFRAVNHATEALLLARTGRHGGTPRVDLPLAAHLLVRNGPLSEDHGRTLVRLFLRGRLVEIWGTWGGRSLYSAAAADDARDWARAFLRDLEPYVDRATAGSD